MDLENLVHWMWTKTGIGKHVVIILELSGKYGAQVQNLLKVAATLDIQIICPLHGPVLTENLGHYIEKYNIWSSYGVESEGVMIAYGICVWQYKESSRASG